jgi:hypothetical protein
MAEGLYLPEPGDRKRIYGRSRIDLQLQESRYAGSERRVPSYRLGRIVVYLKASLRRPRRIKQKLDFESAKGSFWREAAVRGFSRWPALRSLGIAERLGFAGWQAIASRRLPKTLAGPAPGVHLARHPGSLWLFDTDRTSSPTRIIISSVNPRRALAVTGFAWRVLKRDTRRTADALLMLRQPKHPQL